LLSPVLYTQANSQTLPPKCSGYGQDLYGKAGTGTGVTEDKSMKPTIQELDQTIVAMTLTLNRLKQVNARSRRLEQLGLLRPSTCLPLSAAHPLPGTAPLAAFQA
jgi:hypothetical protein